VTPSPRFPRLAAPACFALGLVACSSAHGSAAEAPPDAAADVETDGGVDATDDVDKAATCSPTFGSALTNAFGRADGTVVAVVPPDDQACAMPNATHLVVQVLLEGAVYRMVIDVLSSTDPVDVLFYEMDAPLAGGPWSEGWNTGVMLDYVSTLGVHTPSFTSMTEDAVVAKITGEIELGAHISVFATVDGEPSSAHLVHRNATNQDGAIVVNPETAPHYLLIQFGDQSF
jgi:hypothetical protein